MVPFKAIKIHEILDLTVRITWITKVMKDRGIFDWDLGVHGIQMDCELNGVAYCSSILPNTIKKNRWSKRQAILELLRRAGFEGEWATVVKRMRITAFECKSISLYYRNWPEGPRPI